MFGAIESIPGDPFLNSLAIVQLLAALILPTIGVLGLVREGYLSLILRRKPRKRRLVLFGVVLTVGLLAMLVPISN